jgi:hypothetical protein
MEPSMRRLIVAAGAACLSLTGVVVAQAASGTGAAAGGSGCATGQFSVRNGQVVDPNGNVFVGRGINIGPDQMSQASNLLAQFPGVSFIRLASWYSAPYQVSDYADFASQMAAKGVVVEIEDHTASNGAGNGGGQGVEFTGQILSDELSWYSSLASGLKSNPYVWFGTTNEPSTTNASGQTDYAGLAEWQNQIYKTVRAAGNTSPVMLEPEGWNPDSLNADLPASVYAGMTNTIWDFHYYGWVTNYNADQSVVDQNLKDSVAAVQRIKSADGTMPVLIGEFGDSTTGMSIDGNGSQVIQGVIPSGLGYAAWQWRSGAGDALVDGAGNLTAFGQQVAADIKAHPAGSSAPCSTPTPTASVTPTGTPSPTDSASPTGTVTTTTQPSESTQPSDPGPVSADGTVVTAGSGGAITDAARHRWTIDANGLVDVDGTPDPTTARVTQLAYVGGQVWQENADNLWWAKTGPSDQWSPAYGTSTSPLSGQSPTASSTPTPSLAGPSPSAGPPSTTRRHHRTRHH